MVLRVFRPFLVSFGLTFVLSLVALTFYLVQSGLFEIIFLGATGVSGLLTILAFRYGYRRAPENPRWAKTR